MKKIKSFNPHIKSIEELINEFKEIGVYSTYSISEGYEVIKKMIREKYFIFLSFTGHLVITQRQIFSELIKKKYVSAVVTSGAGIVHDVIEALKGVHYKGSFNENDIELHKKGLGRVGNILVPNEDFQKFEDFIQKTLKDIEKEKKIISIEGLNYELGKRINDSNSFLFNAYKHKVPVYCPGFQDSMLGLQIALFNQDHKLIINSTEDMIPLAFKLYNAKKVGAMILGGGVPKHYTLGSCILRGGIDAAVNITTAQPWDGSLSGAKLHEAKSWGKAKEKSNLVTIYGDANMIFPIIASVILKS